MCRRNSSNFIARVTSGHMRSEEHTSELQSQSNLVCRLLLEKKKHNQPDIEAIPSKRVCLLPTHERLSRPGSLPEAPQIIPHPWVLAVGIVPAVEARHLVLIL